MDREEIIELLRAAVVNIQNGHRWAGLTLPPLVIAEHQVKKAIEMMEEGG